MSLTPGLTMDILAAVILLFSMFQGARKGFARTLSSFVQWFGCIIAGFFLCASVKDYLMQNTTLDEAINSYILDHITTTIEESPSYQSIPALFGEWLNKNNNGFIYGTSASLTDVLLTIISFLLIIFAIKILCSIFMLLFSKENHEGLIGFLDGLVGFLFGAVKGVLLIFLAFAFMVPVLSLLPGTLSEAIMAAVDQSQVASFLYDDNLLLILVRDLFS